LLVSSTLAVCQQPALSDNFVGTWQLNANKSSRSGVERESIQIDFQGGQYKFVCDRLGENGTELNWWFQTDMKGECVILTGVDGKPMSGTSCVTRLSPRKFVNDTKIIHEEYQVSSDGRQLINHTKFKLEYAPGKRLPEVKLVFDRVLKDGSALTH